MRSGRDTRPCQRTIVGSQIPRRQSQPSPCQCSRSRRRRTDGKPFPELSRAAQRQNVIPWHSLLMNGGHDLADIGRYRTHADPMQIVSGNLHTPKVHFEAPPLLAVPQAMREFIAWFNTSGPSSHSPMSALARSGIAHLWFESIHPFEDGNGRLGRAIAEKALAQGLDARSCGDDPAASQRLLHAASASERAEPYRRVARLVFRYCPCGSTTHARAGSLPDCKKPSCLIVFAVESTCDKTKLFYECSRKGRMASEEV